MTQTVLALTTTFVPAPPCLTDVYLYYNTTPTPTYFYSLGPPDTSDCFPPGWKPVNTTYFSPGVCPLGYRVACSTYNSIGTLTETTATCCPSGYTCFTPVGTPLFTEEVCSSGFTMNGYITVTTTNSQGNGTIKTAVHSGTDGINAFGVILRYQSSDFITTSLSSTLSVNDGMPTSLPTTSLPTARIPSASSPASPSTTTSTALGATSGNTSRNIGIGVGVSVGSIGILGILIAIWLVRRTNLMIMILGALVRG
ncbi:hypothetical protein V8E54_004835 [Elaphomyces granulatus]